MVLIERLNDVVRLGQSLPQPECKRHFRIGQMTQNFAYRPFAGTKAPLQPVWSEPLHECTQLPEVSATTVFASRSPNCLA